MVRQRCDSMSRGRKPSIREMESDIKDMRQYLMQFTQAVSMDIHRLNVILFSYLKEQGAAEEVTCHSCQQEILIPLIKGIEREEICPSCNKPLNEGQPTLNDFTGESE